jgi:hypothetical protein
VIGIVAEGGAQSFYRGIEPSVCIDISGLWPQTRDQFLAPDQGTGPLNQEFENFKCLLRQALAHAAALDLRGGEIKDRIAEANLAPG